MNDGLRPDLDRLDNLAWSARKAQSLNSFELPRVVSVVRQNTVQAI